MNPDISPGKKLWLKAHAVEGDPPEGCALVSVKCNGQNVELCVNLGTVKERNLPEPPPDEE